MPTVVNQTIFDSVMERVMLVELASQDVDRQVQRILRDSDAEVVRLLRTGGNTDRLIKRIDRRITKAYTNAYRVTASEISDFIGGEVDFQDAVLRNNIGEAVRLNKPSVRKLRKAILTSRVTIDGTPRKTPFNFIMGLAEKEKRQVRLGLQQGLIQGLNSEQIADMIYGAGSFTSPPRLTRSQFRTITRTSITDAQARTSIETYRMNPDVIERYKYVATLDSRTSNICINHDGKIYPVTGDHPRPPLHFNCRSVTIPITKKYGDVSERSRKGGVSDQLRAAMNGQVPADQNYSDWLRGQPLTVQDNILGRDLADYWRETNVDLKRVINTRGRRVRLSTLRSLSADVARGQNVRVIAQSGVDVTQFDVTDRISSFANLKGATNQLDDFFAAQGGTGSPFGRVNKKNPPVGGVYQEYFDEDIGEYVQQTEISLDQTTYQKQWDLADADLKSGKITLAQRKWLTTSVRQFSRNLDGNQRTVVLRSLRPLLVRINAGNPPGNINAWLTSQLKENSRRLRADLQGRLNDTISRTPLSTLYDFKNRRSQLKKITVQLASEEASASSLELVAPIRLRYAIVDEITDEQLSSILFQAVRNGVGSSAIRVADNIGRKVSSIVGRELNTVQLGFDLIEELLNTPNSPISTTLLRRRVKAASSLGGGLENDLVKYVYKDVVVLQAESSRWKRFAELKTQERQARTLPRNRSQIDTPEVGDIQDSTGRAYKSDKFGVETNPAVNRKDVDTITLSNDTALTPNPHIARTLEELADEDLVYILQREGYADEITGAVNPQWQDIIGINQIRAGKASYFQHTVDYRGRVYPAAYPSSYNGTKLEKANWDFHQRRSLNDDFPDYAREQALEAGVDLNDLSLQFAGADAIGGPAKLLNTLEGRLAIFDMNRVNLLDLGRNRLGDGKLTTANKKFLSQVDDPIGTTRLAIELAEREAYRGPPGRRVTGIRIPQDATASAVQYSAILTRKIKIARQSNLTPNAIKRSSYEDAWIRVASSESFRSDPFLRKLTQEQGTKIAKHPLMTSFYGAGSDSQLGQVRSALRQIIDADKELKVLAGGLENLTDPQLRSVVNALRRAIDEEIPELGGLLRFFRNFGQHSAQTSGRIRWREPLSGEFYEYGVLKTAQREVEFEFDGKVLRETILEVTDEIDVEETARIFSPNFIHSIDAGEVTFIKKRAARQGVPITSNHDSFSTAPGDYYRINKELKQGLIRTSDRNPLRRLLDDALDNGNITPEQFADLTDQLDNGIMVRGNRININPDDPDSATTFKSLEELGILDSIFTFS